MSDELDGLQFLQVTNNTDAKIRARFHGIDYVWDVGEAVTIPVDAGVHIFGFGLEDKRASLHRLGWLTMSTQEDAALLKLSQILFEPVHQVYELQTQRRPRGKRAAVTVQAQTDDGEAESAEAN